jgi:hypothetical protein
MSRLHTRCGESVGVNRHSTSLRFPFAHLVNKRRKVVKWPGNDSHSEQPVTRRLLSWFGGGFCRLHGLFEWNLLALRIHPVNVKRCIG